MKWWQLGFVVFLVTGLVGCDHATKALASTELRAGSVAVIPGVFELTYAENRDSAFSLLHPLLAEPHRRPLLLAGASLGVLMGLAALALRWGQSRWLEKLAVATMVAGGLGNLTDRAARGYVIDWMHLTHWPVFNVADVAIVAGAALMILASRAPASGLGSPQGGEASPTPSG